MAPAPPTVLSLKQSFLTTQTRLLSQPLSPTRAWHNNNANSNNTNNSETQSEILPPKALDDALFKLNHRLQQHARRAYAPQATRHVAEQIDQLYWNAAEAAQREGDGDEDGGEGVEGLGVGADLGDPKIIATLPLEWEDSSSSSSQPLEAKRYAELAGELHALAERKQQANARMARLRRMQALLEPFSANPDGNDDGGLDGVQENLVTRNGEVEAELHRMRMLLARVGGRVGQLKEGDQQARESSAGSLFSDRGEGMEDVEMDEQRKVGLLLERF